MVVGIVQSWRVRRVQGRMAALVRQKGGPAVDESRFRSDLTRWIPCLINDFVTSGPLLSLAWSNCPVSLPTQPDGAFGSNVTSVFAPGWPWWIQLVQTLDSKAGLDADSARLKGLREHVSLDASYRSAVRLMFSSMITR